MRNLKFLCAAACQLTGLGAANTILDNLRDFAPKLFKF